MKILHIIREKEHELALSTALAQAVSASGGLSVSGGQGGERKVILLLIHDGVLTQANSLKEAVSATGERALEVFALKDDVEARGINVPYPLLDYEGMLRLIFESDKVITW